ncbi:hypothetical protein BDY21DRAFT_359244 [Lineolata rhizophorae]|uniref:Uncharacterized protein n=1 Tax=Lineolata rhizophorae TaxID=578093 RepID=A0A6A6NLE2_9PEZI|nr:hypothetical protein BDY21DRAFT_359244 [Lineolata rhizophorae]
MYKALLPAPTRQSFATVSIRFESPNLLPLQFARARGRFRERVWVGCCHAPQQYSRNHHHTSARRGVEPSTVLRDGAALPRHVSRDPVPLRLRLSPPARAHRVRALPQARISGATLRRLLRHLPGRAGHRGDGSAAGVLRRRVQGLLLHDQAARRRVPVRERAVLPAIALRLLGA